MKTGIFTTEGTEDTEVKPGKVCPLITRMNTNKYFAVNLTLHHKIKLTASVSVLLVLPLCGMPFVDKNVFLCSFVCFVDDNARNGFKLLFNDSPKCRSRLFQMAVWEGYAPS